MKLTEKQKEFLGYVAGYISEWGVSPSFEEIRARFGYSSFNTVTTYLRILERKGYIRLPVEKNRKRAIQVIRPFESRAFELPLLGQVAAGKPIEALETKDVIEIPPSMVGQGDNFVLRVKGESMKEDGILDGDYIVVRRQPDAENGETVVALVNNEATVKRDHRKNGVVELRPAHQGMKPILVKREDFRIQGKVVGVIRRYS
jgi:repressor LexA